MNPEEVAQIEENVRTLANERCPRLVGMQYARLYRDIIGKLPQDMRNEGRMRGCNLRPQGGVAAIDGTGVRHKPPAIEVSVVIVNYNGKSYVETCINSILRSGYDKLEIIVVDNGSSDGSVDYFRRKCEGWRGKIEVISLSKNNGPAAARNRGARIALGRYLCFLDNDTVVHPAWARRQSPASKGNHKSGSFSANCCWPTIRGGSITSENIWDSTGFSCRRLKGGRSIWGNMK